MSSHTDVLEILKKLPPVVYVDVDLTGKNPKAMFVGTDAPLVAIKRGEDGFYPIYTSHDAAFFNDAAGVTETQIEAMKCGSMFGWDCPGADVDYLQAQIDKRVAKAPRS